MLQLVLPFFLLAMFHFTTQTYEGPALPWYDVGATHLRRARAHRNRLYRAAIHTR